MIQNVLIAHRGESFDAPENTLASINLAWERNVHAVEIDIQLTVDNEIVVIHDKNTLRVSGVKKIIKKSTLAELKLLDSGSFKDSKWKNERIPTLKEVLDTIPENGKLIIEIKSDDKILTKLNVELSQSKLKDSQIEIIAFNVKTLAKAKKLMPQYKVLWLLDMDYFWPHWLCFTNSSKLVNKVQSLNLDGVDVWAGKLLTKQFIEKCKNAGLFVYTWTVNDPLKAVQLIEFDIDGITTDKAYWMAEQLKR